jgi:hypothetical protein
MLGNSKRPISNFYRYRADADSGLDYSGTAVSL